MTERQQTHYVGDDCDGGRGHRRDCVVCGGTGAELLAPEDEMSDGREGTFRACWSCGGNGLGGPEDNDDEEGTP